MRVTIQPSPLKGVITAPASKSAMQRACALALLHNGETIIVNPGKSNDDLAAIEMIQQLGAVVKNDVSGSTHICGMTLAGSLKAAVPAGGGSKEALNCGESGLGIRMFAPIAALSSEEIILTGEGSLLSRPMHFFDEYFPPLGVTIHSHNGRLPIKIKGPMQPKDITVDGSLSSQFLTGLLMAFAKAANKQVTITVINLKSKPYIDLTLQMMQHFGYEVSNENYQKFIIKPQSPNPKYKTYTVEGDWSSAAFLLVAGAIAGGITVQGLDVFSTQGDKAILQALMMAGADLSVSEKEIIVSSSPFPQDALQGKRGKAFHFNATDCPDLFPPLVVLAAHCVGTSVIEGVSRLVHKESNRALSLQLEFAKMGVEITIQDNLMMIKGAEKMKAASVRSHHDHRIAMACAVAALTADGETIMEDAEAVNKSYPDFYEHLKLLGANVSLRIN